MATLAIIKAARDEEMETVNSEVLTLFDKMARIQTQYLQGMKQSTLTYLAKKPNTFIETQLEEIEKLNSTIIDLINRSKKFFKMYSEAETENFDLGIKLRKLELENSVLKEELQKTRELHRAIELN